EERPATRHSAFGFSMVIRPRARFDRAAMMRYLEERGVETRPIAGSNMARQPGLRRWPSRAGARRLPGAAAVLARRLFVGNPAKITARGYFFVSPRQRASACSTASVPRAISYAAGQPRDPASAT